MSERQETSMRAWLVCAGSFVCYMVIGGQISCSGVFLSVFLEAYNTTRGEAGNSKLIEVIRDS